MRAAVLVIDDSSTVRHHVSRVLTDAGFSVTLATDGVDALLKFDAGAAPKLILCDVNMPRMSGLEFLEALRERNLTVPIIMLSAEGQPELVQHAKSLGAKAWIVKPLAPELLLEWATKLLAGQDQQVGLFVEETTELLQRLEQGLLGWQGTGKQDEVQALFRAAHTIKSNAGILGATECVRLAQWVESVLLAVRDGTIHPDDGVVDTLLQSVEALRQMTHAIASGQANPGLDDNLSLWRALTELADRDARFGRITQSVYGDEAPR